MKTGLKHLTWRLQSCWLIGLSIEHTLCVRRESVVDPLCEIPGEILMTWTEQMLIQNKQQRNRNKDLRVLLRMSKDRGRLISPGRSHLLVLICQSFQQRRSTRALDLRFFDLASTAVARNAYLSCLRINSRFMK